jgi:hypothetical protein
MFCFVFFHSAIQGMAEHTHHLCFPDARKQPRTQGLKDPGWGWSRNFTKIDWLRGEGRVSNCMLPQKMLHFNCKE